MLWPRFVGDPFSYDTKIKSSISQNVERLSAQSSGVCKDSERRVIKVKYE